MRWPLISITFFKKIETISFQPRADSCWQYKLPESAASTSFLPADKKKLAITRFFLASFPTGSSSVSSPDVSWLWKWGYHCPATSTHPTTNNNNQKNNQSQRLEFPTSTSNGERPTHSFIISTSRSGVSGAWSLLLSLT